MGGQIGVCDFAYAPLWGALSRPPVCVGGLPAPARGGNIHACVVPISGQVFRMIRARLPALLSAVA